MKVNPITVKINDLIDEHNQVSAYGQCPGCDLCIEIERISKEVGMWIDDIKSQTIEKMRINRIRSAQVSKEELEKLIQAGLTNKEISKKLGLTEKIISCKIKKFFPGINRRKRKEPLGFDLNQYNQMRNKGAKRKDIAKQYGVSVNELDSHLRMLRRARAERKENAMC